MRRAAPCGTMDTTTSIRSTVPSFRTLCTSSPESMKPEPVSYKVGVQVGSSAWYTDAVPCRTVTILGPGWLCQPIMPPGTNVLTRLWTSTLSFVRIVTLASPAFCTLIGSSNVPKPDDPTGTGTLVNPTGGVAKATSGQAETPA